jgi:signal transduction histidine kinase
VTDLLDMAKLQNGRLKLALQPLNLADVAADVAATMRPLTDSKGQHLELHFQPGIPPAYADRRRVEQVLNNLLSNAQRYTPKGSQICLGIEQARAGLLVSIRDNGPGLTSAEQAHVFERFYRGQHAKGGTGLGLAIARSLVELHGGRIWVESQPGAGSTFFFTLPIASVLALTALTG